MERLQLRRLALSSNDDTVSDTDISARHLRAFRGPHWSFTTRALSRNPGNQESQDRREGNTVIDTARLLPMRSFPNRSVPQS